jgi:hypothetical protein
MQEGSAQARNPMCGIRPQQTRRLVFVSSALFILALILTSCGGSSQSASNTTSTTHDPNSASSSTAQSTPTSPTTTSTAPPASNNFDQVSDVTDAGGYSFNVSTKIQTQEAYTSGANAPIGSTLIVLPVTGSLVVTNTTPGKNTTTNDFQNLEVGGVYASSRPACSLGQSFQISSGSFCFIPLAGGSNDNSGGQFLAGATFQSTISDPTTNESAGQYPPFGNTVTSATAPGLVSDLNTGPNFWALAVADNELTDRAGGTIFGSDTCILDNGMELFLTSNSTSLASCTVPH